MFVKAHLQLRLNHLAFFGNLIPCFMESQGLDLLQRLLSEGGDERVLRRKCLALLAGQLCGADQLDLETARFALQQVLDGMFWPIRRSQGQGQVVNLFHDCLDLTLDIADSRGIFAKCYALITPALAASAIQQVLETIDAHPSKKSEMLQLLSREFSRRVDLGHPCAIQPLTVWLEWTGLAEGEVSSSLPFLLYAAFRTDVGRKLLELDKADALEELQRERLKQHQEGNIFAYVRRAARHHLLIEAVADRVARRQIATASDARLLQEVLGGAGAGGAEDPDPASLLFFHSLVAHAGSMATAGRALETLVQMHGGAAEGSLLRAWAGALAKPETAAGGRCLHVTHVGRFFRRVGPNMCM